jgi:crotonobetainyl-CoA:carnitine CoA-transferase CaiB-like acyl-CoA transferase
MLKDVRVLDLSRVLAGPWATQLLADLGADVIKVERPGTGDDTRAWGPPWLQDEAGQSTGESAYFLCANRNKRSITVDLSHPDGQAAIRRLAASADVLVENFKVGDLARFGLDYAALKSLNPRLVYCSITGFGQTGVDARRAGYDAMIQAVGGLMSITGEPDRAPQKVGVAAADLMCGMYASSGILAALLKARKTGEGDHIDLALFDTQLAWLANQAMNQLLTGVPPERRGSAHPSIVPYRPFECADGHLMLAVGNDRQFSRWCRVAGVPEWAEDERFASNAARVVNQADLIALMEPLIKSRSKKDWLKSCREIGVPCGPINDLAEAFAEPQVEDRQMLVSIPHDRAGELPLVGDPLKFSSRQPEPPSAPPELGEHTDEVLLEFGWSKEEIHALRRDGAIG